MPAVPLPALHASHAGTWLRPATGSTRAIGKGEAVVAAADTPLLLLNAPLVATRLGYPDLSGLDLLELYAFVHPALSQVSRSAPAASCSSAGTASSPAGSARPSAWAMPFGVGTTNRAG